MSKPTMITVRCPNCDQIRTIQKRHKYESTTTKVCAKCVPKVNNMTLNYVKKAHSLYRDAQ